MKRIDRFKGPVLSVRPKEQLLFQMFRGYILSQIIQSIACSTENLSKILDVGNKKRQLRYFLPLLQNCFSEITLLLPESGYLRFFNLSHCNISTKLSSLFFPSRIFTIPAHSSHFYMSIQIAPTCTFSQLQFSATFAKPSITFIFE